MQLNNNLVNGLQTTITEFKNKLPSLTDLKLQGTFQYGCCNKPIEEYTTNQINHISRCPYCLDYYESVQTYDNGYGYYNPVIIRPAFSDNYNKIPMIDDKGIQLFKGNSDNYKFYSSKEQFIEKYGELKFIGKECRVIFDNQKEFDIISNILDMVSESMYTFSIYLNIEFQSFRKDNQFGASELEYINEKGLNDEFSHIMSVKQILINKVLIDSVKMIAEKMSNAGMTLL